MCLCEGQRALLIILSPRPVSSGSAPPLNWPDRRQVKSPYGVVNTVWSPKKNKPNVIFPLASQSSIPCPPFIPAALSSILLSFALRGGSFNRIKSFELYWPRRDDIPLITPRIRSRFSHSILSRFSNFRRQSFVSFTSLVSNFLTPLYQGTFLIAFKCLRIYLYGISRGYFPDTFIFSDQLGADFYFLSENSLP